MENYKNRLFRKNKKHFKKTGDRKGRPYIVSINIIALQKTEPPFRHLRCYLP